MKTLQKKSAAFTLIELLVVVAIIALLISILVPVLFRARKSAYAAATQSQMSGISTACESYYQMFRAYPGLLSEASYTTASAFSSSQALVVSLSRFFCTPNADANSFATNAIPGVTPATYVSTNPSVSPRDYSDNPTLNTVGNPTGRTYTPFINTEAKDLSGTICNSATAPLAVLPTFIDSAYGSQALPILYYRAARKYDPSVLAPAAMVPVSDSATANANAGFYASSNTYLGTITSTMSTPVQNSGLAAALTTSALTNNNTLTQVINGVGTTRGGYVLISAGSDRQYGTTDDIIIAGGI